MTGDSPPQRRRAAVRLRLGLGLWLFSWLPLPVAILELARLFGANPSNSAAHEFLVVAYTAQVLIGLGGIAIAGAATIRVVKQLGWRQTPRAVWRILRSGSTEQATVMSER